MRSGTRHVLIEDPQTAGSSFMDHNLLAGNLSINWGGLLFSSLGAFQSSTGRGAGCFNTDPLFVNVIGGDFHLQGSSSGVNSGAGLNVFGTFLQRYGFEIDVDRDRRPRPLGPLPDMGCYEQ